MLILFPIPGVDVLGFLVELRECIRISITFVDFVLEPSWKTLIKPVPQSGFAPWTARTANDLKWTRYSEIH